LDLSESISGFEMQQLQLQSAVDSMHEVVNMVNATDANEDTKAAAELARSSVAELVVELNARVRNLSDRLLNIVGQL
jgi:hypothetical protein